MDIPYSTNLLLHGSFSISKPTVVSEYLRSMCPTHPWSQFDNSVPTSNLVQMGYNISYGVYRIHLTTGVKDLVPGYQYFCPLGTVLEPEECSDQRGTVRLSTRSLYFVRETSMLGKVMIQKNYGYCQGGKVYFYSATEGDIKLTTDTIEVTLSYSESEMVMDIKKTETGYLVVRPSMGTVPCNTWSDVEKLFAGNLTFLEKFRPDKKVIQVTNDVVIPGARKKRKLPHGPKVVDVIDPWEPYSQSQELPYFARYGNNVVALYGDHRLQFLSLTYVFQRKDVAAVLDPLIERNGGLVRLVKGIEVMKESCSLLDLARFVFRDGDPYSCGYKLFSSMKIGKHLPWLLAIIGKTEKGGVIQVLVMLESCLAWQILLLRFWHILAMIVLLVWLRRMPASTSLEPLMLLIVRGWILCHVFCFQRTQ